MPVMVIVQCTYVHIFDKKHMEILIAVTSSNKINFSNLVVVSS